MKKIFLLGLLLLGYSTISAQNVESWSGTGFALKSGYIATNYHVIEDADYIMVRGIKGAFNDAYTARVVVADIHNDLAIIKISDSRFSSFCVTIPYSIKSTTAEVGENIFVLGYPLTTIMGEELKLTTGVVSSKSGFMGDVSLYQISAPVQPGNSGGPLFDNRGNLIGVVNAKIGVAENVSYAIKSSYLKNLAESASLGTILPTSNTLSNLTLSEKVKNLRNLVFMIECSKNASESSHATLQGSSSSHSNSSQKSSSSLPKRRVSYDTIFITEIPQDKPYFPSGTRLEIKKIYLTSAKTIIEFEFYIGCCDDIPEYMSIEQGAYIVANGQQKKMLKAENIKIAPEKTYFAQPYDSKRFKLYFDPINKGTRQIDFIESPTSKWQIKNIILQ